MTTAPTPFQSGRRHHSFELRLAVVLALVLVALGVVLLVRRDLFRSSSGSSGAHGSGVAATQTRSLARFTGIELAGSNVVAIRVGPKQSVVVHADDNLLRRVTTQVKAGVLVVGNTPGSFTTKSPMSVGIIVPSLRALDLAGSGVISASGIQTRSLTARVSGSGVLVARGSVDRLDVTVSGSGDARLDALVARDVRAVVSGSGRILVTATESLDAAVPGTGAITYSGNPAHVTTSVTGVGAVMQR
jgi:hypothetical protein